MVTELFMAKNKFSSILVASLLAATQLSVQAQSAAGAGAATNSAVGGVSTSTIVATAAGVALIASLSSGNGGSFGAANVASSDGAKSSAAAATNAAASNTAVSTALTQLQAALVAAGLNTDPNIAYAYTQADLATKAAVVAATAAANAASDLAAASAVAVVGVVNGGRTICAAATSCTKAEILALSFNAALTAQKAVDATNFALLWSNTLKTAILAKSPTFAITAFNTALTTAAAESVKAQAAADQAESEYVKVATLQGKTATTIAATTGTTGTFGAAGTSGTSGTTGTN